MMMKQCMMLYQLYLMIIIIVILMQFSNSSEIDEAYHNNSVDLLEALAYKYGSDKSKDDHKYVDLYESLFQSRRRHIKNMTEIGVSAGQSLQMWDDYFPEADIHGIDILIDDKVKANLNNRKRVHLYQSDGTIEIEVNKLGYSPSSMDLIIEDGPHTRESQEKFLRIFWKYLKPNGLYIIEDVDAQRGGLDFAEHPDKLEEFTKEILKHNHVFFVDTHVGHRNWDHWLKMVSSEWAKDHHVHNSYLLVIRKRASREPQILTNYGNVAMNPLKIVS